MAAASALTTACDAHRDAPASQLRVVDLGHPLSAADPTWSGSSVFTRTTVATFDRDAYSAGAFSTDEHFGTHVDAPAHFAKDGWTVDRIPIDRLVRPAVCIDIRDKIAAAEDYQLSVEDVRDFERRHGSIPAASLSPHRASSAKTRAGAPLPSFTFAGATTTVKPVAGSDVSCAAFSMW
jgi:kynurenine formamidase